MTFPANPETFLEDAQHLLTASEHCSEADDAVEFAYQAALRVAGAVLATLPRKRGGPTGAWAQLRHRIPELADWAAKFEAYSRLRSRLLMGLERDVDPAVPEQLRLLARSFMTDVHQTLGYVPLAA